MPRGNAFDRIKELLNVVADASTTLHQILFGTSGTKVFYPDGDDYEGAKLHDTGKQLETGAMLEFALKNGLGGFVDERSISWATIGTNATGVAPTYTASAGFATATAITKDEVGNRITLTFDDNYSNASYVVLGRSGDGAPQSSAWAHAETAAVDTVRLEFYKYDTATKQTINDRTVWILVVGDRS